MSASALEVRVVWFDTVLDSFFTAEGRPDDRLGGMLDTIPDIAEGETLALPWGPLTLQLRHPPEASMRLAPFWERVEHNWVNALLLAAFAHVLLLTTFVATPNPKLTGMRERRLPSFRPATLVLPPPRPQLPSPAKAAGEEGLAGSKQLTHRTNKRRAVRGDPSKADIRGTIAALLGTQGNRKTVFGTGGLGGELLAGVGNVTGRQIGDSAGLGGLGTRGYGPGGGGRSLHSVGIGDIERSNAIPGGRRLGGLEKTIHEVADPELGPPEIIGALDRELIRAVVDQHRAQIRYCYERELQKRQGLFGKLTVRWTIKANGRVTSAHAIDSSMDAPALSQCVLRKIESWQFPKPRGGGIVVVTYPFLFKH